MSKISIEEFRKNEKKYFNLAKTEKIEVIQNNKVVFTVDEILKRIKIANSLIGVLPKDATIGLDEDERG